MRIKQIVRRFTAENSRKLIVSAKPTKDDAAKFTVTVRYRNADGKAIVTKKVEPAPAEQAIATVKGFADQAIKGGWVEVVRAAAERRPIFDGIPSVGQLVEIDARIDAAQKVRKPRAPKPAGEKKAKPVKPIAQRPRLAPAK